MGQEHESKVEKLPSGGAFVPSETIRSKIAEIAGRYPYKKSAVMPALYLVQEQQGWISPESMAWVAAELDLPLSHVREVTSFYTMYYQKPVGRYHIQVCRTLSCMVCGAEALVAKLKSHLTLSRPMEISSDGLWSYEEVECLGSCGTAPMIQINDAFFENLTPDSLVQVLDSIAREQPDLRFLTTAGGLGGQLTGAPRSQVYVGGER